MVGNDAVSLRRLITARLDPRKRRTARHQFTPATNGRLPPTNGRRDIRQLYVKFTVAVYPSATQSVSAWVSLSSYYERLSCEHVVVTSMAAFRPAYESELIKNLNSPHSRSHRPFCGWCYLFTASNSGLLLFYTTSELVFPISLSLSVEKGTFSSYDFEL